jgi:WhiB family transcriptional regulator, redox-sensing transcriptional regulator
MSMSDFRDRAACRDTDPELFFPIGTGGPALAQIVAAKAVCRRCQVTPECLSWATLTGQRDGIWGGLDALERHDLCRREARAAGAAFD